ncbi:MAG: hypothetical protein ACI9MJ_001478, partial [Alphaproteobacteria bacterium]
AVILIVSAAAAGACSKATDATVALSNVIALESFNFSNFIVSSAWIPIEFVESHVYRSFADTIPKSHFSQ